MALKIRNAILHILRNDGPPSVFSDAELDIDSEVCEAFIGKHVKKLINNAAVKTAHFKPDAELYNLLIEYQQREKHFMETALVMAQRLDGIMEQEKSIPPCDMLVARVGQKTGEFIAVLLLHHHDVYAHKTVGSENMLHMCRALPFNTGKVEFAVLIALEGDSMGINIIEKPVEIYGVGTLYFSEMFLECETSPSRKEQAVLINDVTTEFVDEFFKGDPNVSAKIKTALVEEADAEDGFVSMDNVARVAFEAQDEVREQYVNTLRDAGVREDLPLGQSVVKQQFAMHKIKAENGVEIRFPAELAASEDGVEITSHGDGTVSVLLKNLRMV